MKIINTIIFAVLFTAINAQQISILDDFSSCQLNNGWSTKTIAGSNGFEMAPNDQAVIVSPGCMVQYIQRNPDLDGLRQFQLISPEYNLVSGLTHYFIFNLRYVRAITSNLTLSYDGPKGKVTLSLSPTNDLSPFSFAIAAANGFVKTRFTFEYSATTNDFGNQIYIDDILFVSDNADCSRAQVITSDNSCLYGHMYPYQYYQSGGQTCPGEYQSALWYQYKADFNGIIQFSAHSDYNNSVSVFEGSCGSLTSVSCYNQDEYGFTGESLELKVIDGKTYYFKLSRKINDFGKEIGMHCIQIEKLSQSKIIKPPHDLCTSSQSITINGSCTKGVNYYAGIESKVPSTNNRSRADVWYKFTALSNKSLEIITHSDFAEVITLYKGDCNALEEIATEDLGGKLLFVPQIGKEYYVQVSGFFSTVEGDLCLEVKELTAPKPTNDDCVSSTAIALNAQCKEIDFLANNTSLKKPSCVVYNAPDVWYSFVAPAEKQVNLLIDAGFIYHWAIYQEPCNNLLEIACGRAPDPCEGSINVKGLIAGKTYYLQIIAATVPLKAGEGKLCVRIDETSKTEVFQSLRLGLTTECLHGVLTRVTNYTVTGGKPMYSYFGPESNDYFTPGSEITAFVEDGNGCRAFAKTEAQCQGGSKCRNSNLDINLTTDCIKDSIGRQTGEVTLNYTGQGGSGAYYFYGTQNNSVLRHGDAYKILLIDTDSCYVFEEGKINCPPFNCAQSNLKVAVSYDCIDTLFKARLNVNISGALGTYTSTGSNDGDLFNHGDYYAVTVTDQAGCTSLASGEIICKFDSCAYARPILDVSYKCLRDSIGQTSGLAELIVNGSSRAGAVSYIGHQPGQILKHLDTYKVEMKDAFGCSQISEGIINCIPLSVSDKEFASSIVYSPNPTSGEVLVKFNSANSEQFKLSIYNVESKLISIQNEKVQIGDNKFVVDLEKMQSGIYFLELKSNSVKAVLKLVKL